MARARGATHARRTCYGKSHDDETSPQHLKALNDLHTLSVGVRKPVRIFDAQSKGVPQ